MEKLKSSITNMVLVLVGVALITGSILAYVNSITQGPIQQQAEKSLADGIKQVMGGGNMNVTSTDTVKQNINGKETAFVIHQTQNDQHKDLGVAIESTTGGFGGDLKILVGFDVKGNILGYKLLAHAETPGLGAKADQWFQKGGKGDIIGKNPATDNLTVSKDGGKIDAITASTITSRAFLLAVTQAYNAYNKKQADAHSGASTQNKNIKH